MQGIKKIKVSATGRGGPRGSGRLTLWIFMTFSTMKVVRSSPSCTGRVCPQEYPGTHFRGWVEMQGILCKIQELKLLPVLSEVLATLWACCLELYLTFGIKVLNVPASECNHCCWTCRTAMRVLLSVGTFFLDYQFNSQCAVTAGASMA
jgi:hypothetical protein